MIGNFGNGADWTYGMSADEAALALDAARRNPSSPYYVPPQQTAEPSRPEDVWEILDRVLAAIERIERRVEVLENVSEAGREYWPIVRDHEARLDRDDGRIQVLETHRRGDAA